MTDDNSNISKNSSGNNNNNNNNIPSNANEGCVGPSSKDAGKASACDGCPNQGACSSSGGGSSIAIEQQQDAETMALRRNLANVSHVVLVVSGKGGVGKSTIACQIAHSLSSKYGGCNAVGILDVDLCGPSTPRMILGGRNSNNGNGNGSSNSKNISPPPQQQKINKSSSTGAWIPLYARKNDDDDDADDDDDDNMNVSGGTLAIMSISFLLSNDNANQAIIWRGPRKNALIQQFLTQVDWTGDTDGLDYLIIDTPPGTSDEHISIVQYLQRCTSNNNNTNNNISISAIVVTTSEEVCLDDVRKEISFCNKTHVPILGIIENMGTYQTRLEQMKFYTTTPSYSGDGGGDRIDCTDTVLKTIREKCPEILDCIVSSKLFDTTSRIGANSSNGKVSSSLSASPVKRMADEYNIEYWGSLPLDPDLLMACENGECFTDLYPPPTSTSTTTTASDENNNNNNINNDNYNDARRRSTTTINPTSQIILDFCQRIQTKLPVDTMEMEAGNQ